MEKEYAIKLADVEKGHAKNISDLQVKLSTEHYDKLNTALSKLHEDGHKGVQFLKDLALEMVSKTPLRPDYVHGEVKLIQDQAQ